ncbi:MAG TPA: hypothetical protein VMT91_09980 [Anaerolineales bacterium]|nr:hypothetical protein [Anaerolineales bacterium]
MPDNYRVVSPKHEALMTNALKNIYSARFDESDMRILLLGIREFSETVAKKTKSIQDAPPAIRSGLSELADIGHALAHPDLKDRGPLRKYVKQTDEELMRRTAMMDYRKVLGINNEQKLINLEMPASIKPLSSQNLFLAFCLALQNFFPYKIDIHEVIEQRDDILLCLFSILHFTQLPNLDNAPITSDASAGRNGYLGLNSWDGKYHLYAGVMNSKFETLFSSSDTQKRQRPFINIFPVYNSSKEVGTGPEMDIFNPQVVFAVRDESGKLKLYLQGQKSPTP